MTPTVTNTEVAFVQQNDSTTLQSVHHASVIHSGLQCRLGSQRPVSPMVTPLIGAATKPATEKGDSPHKDPGPVPP